MKLLRVCECEMEFDRIPFKERPRHTLQGRTYTPQSTQRMERAIVRQWRERFGDSMANFDGPVRVYVRTQRPLCKSNPKYWAGRADLGKPDWDNIGKAVCDALNGVAYKDDSQASIGSVEKLPRTPYGGKPMATVRIEYYMETFEKEKK